MTERNTPQSKNKESKNKGKGVNSRTKWLYGSESQTPEERTGHECVEDLTLCIRGESRGLAGDRHRAEEIGIED